MMSLCKKSVHSFLGFSNSDDNFSPDFSHQNHPPPPPQVGGLIFFSACGDVDRPVNVVESAAVKKPPPLPPTTTTGDVAATTTKGHMGVVGLKEQPAPTTITTTATGHMGGLGFPLPTTTSVVATSTKIDPAGGIEDKKPPLPPTTTAAAAATGHKLGFPKPLLPTTTSVLATTIKSDPAGGIEYKKPPPSPPITTTGTTDILASTTKRNSGSIGFLDEVGVSVDGLMSCTESLGFESSDERRADGQILDTISPPPLSSKPKKTIPLKKREVKKFPPPLSSLTDNGHPKFFLRPVRKDGRLELTEIEIHPLEILHASREDGRLRLQFVCDRNKEVENHAEEEKQETIQEDPKEFQENIQEEREEKLLDWKIPATSGGGDGFRQCHELVASHQRRHHHYHNVWSQRCVTIR